MEVFKVDDVTANNVIQKKQHLLRKESLQISHSNHYCLAFLASNCQKDSNFGFHFWENNFSISILFSLKFVWRLHSTIFELIKLLQICVYVSIAVLFLTKSSQRTSSQHLLFQSLTSNTRGGHERYSTFIKITIKTKVNYCSRLDRFEQTFHLVWVFLWSFYKKQVNVRYGIGSISIQIAWYIHNAANDVIAKNKCQSYFKKLEVLFSR